MLLSHSATNSGQTDKLAITIILSYDSSFVLYFEVQFYDVNMSISYYVYWKCTVKCIFVPFSMMNFAFENF